MNKPLVSIVVPAYCHEKYIDSCLKSICKQSYKNIELIIFDDNSSDDTYNIIQENKAVLEERFGRVVCHRNEVNLGVVKNENEMIKLCKGKYIKSIASDDMLLPNAIHDLVDYFEKHSEFNLIFSNAIYCNETDSYPLEDLRNYIRAYENQPDISGNLMQKLYENNFILAPTVLFKKETFDKYGMYDEAFTIEDWEYWLRIAEIGKIGYCNATTVAYRITGGSLSHFSKDDSGRRRMRNMYYNQLNILKKYENSSEIDSSKGYEKLFNNFIHEAIDIDDKEFVHYLFSESAVVNIKITVETKLKYIAYRLNVLKLIQSMKRKIGLKTVDDYKTNS